MGKFTYIGKETRFVTKLFKNTDVRITFTTDSTPERRLTTKHGTDQSKYDKSGIYQLICPDCKMKYTGQTGNHSKHIPRTLQRLQIRGQQVEIPPTPLRKHRAKKHTPT